MSKMPQPKFYFVCERDGAKFFSSEQTAVCPRCGEKLTSNEKVVPPWRLMKVDELAARLNVSVSKAYAICAKDIEVHKIGGSVRISEDALIRYLKKTRRERDLPTPAKKKQPRPRLRHITLR